MDAKDNSKQIITQADDISLNEKYIDGSVLKRFTFSLVDFRSVVYQPLPKVPDHSTENVEDIIDVQGIIDWVNEQADLENYPNFGSDCMIDSMKTTSDTPNLNGVDTQVTPPLAKYSMSIQIDYIDKSKAFWK